MDATGKRSSRSVLQLGRWIMATTTILVSASAAAAEDAAEMPVAHAEVEERATAEQRPFAFLVDPSTASAGVFSASYTFGLGSGISADRPIPVVLQKEGVSHSIGLGYGVTSWLEVMATATVNTFGTDSAIGGNGLLGVKVQLTDPSSPWRAAVLGGGLYEGESASWGAWVQATGSFSAGPFLVEANAYLEHVFAPDRDALDYIGMLGASYRILPALRVGAEFVGQDLEELAQSGAEGGARLGVGPDVAVDLYRGHVQLVVSALFGLNAVSPTAIVRAGVLGSF
jgi:hypothetical protein